MLAGVIAAHESICIGSDKCRRAVHHGPMPGRHRQLQRTGLIVTAAAVAVAVIAGGAWAGYHEWSRETCATTVQLRVDAAPEIAPAVQAAADAWSKQEDACARVTVTAADPAAVAAAVGAQHGINLAG